MITYERLLELLHYDPDTGIFTWNKNISSRVRCGDTAGTITPDGYISICIDRTVYRAHRLAWLYCFKEWPIEFLDHINGNKQDNRLDNLRECTKVSNSHNISKHKDNKSGYKGVYFNKANNNFRAQIRVNGKTKSLGSFKTAEEAHIAYILAAKEAHGEFFKE